MHICHPFCALSGGRIAVGAYISPNISILGGKNYWSDLMCIKYLTCLPNCIIGSFMITLAKRKALLASGTLNPHPEAVRAELFHTYFFDPYDFAQVKYEMLRAHSVDEDPVAEVCRQFGLKPRKLLSDSAGFSGAGIQFFCNSDTGVGDGEKE